LNIAEKGGRLISLHISNRYRKLKTQDTDCVNIADLYNSAKVWVSYTEYTVFQSTIAREMKTIWDCRYKSSIPKKRKMFEFGYVYNICTFESPDFLQILCRCR
jgi:hypothetical protein